MSLVLQAGVDVLGVNNKRKRTEDAENADPQGEPAAKKAKKGSKVTDGATNKLQTISKKIARPSSTPGRTRLSVRTASQENTPAALDVSHEVLPPEEEAAPAKPVPGKLKKDTAAMKKLEAVIGGGPRQKQATQVAKPASKWGDPLANVETPVAPPTSAPAPTTFEQTEEMETNPVAVVEAMVKEACSATPVAVMAQSREYEELREKYDNLHLRFEGTMQKLRERLSSFADYDRVTDEKLRLSTELVTDLTKQNTQLLTEAACRQAEVDEAMVLRYETEKTEMTTQLTAATTELKSVKQKLADTEGGFQMLRSELAKARAEVAAVEAQREGMVVEVAPVAPVVAPTAAEMQQLEMYKRLTGITIEPTEVSDLFAVTCYSKELDRAITFELAYDGEDKSMDYKRRRIEIKDGAVEIPEFLYEEEISFPESFSPVFVAKILNTVFGVKVKSASV